MGKSIYAVYQKEKEDLFMDYQKLLEWRNHYNDFSSLLDMEVTEISQGCAKAEIPVSAKHMNPIGSVHGGCLFTLMDVVGGAAAFSHGFYVTTVDASIHYLRAGLNTTRLIASARELKYGKNILVYNVSVTDQDGKVLCEGIFTYMSLGKKIEL